jgi:hypothetical protein
VSGRVPESRVGCERSNDEFDRRDARLEQLEVFVFGVAVGVLLLAFVQAVLL